MGELGTAKKLVFGVAKKWNGQTDKNMWFRQNLPDGKSSDGSKYHVYYKRGSTQNLMVYFSGGGASWTEETAANPITLNSMKSGKTGYYFPNLATYLELLLTGILAANDPRNPFNDWNVVYIPYSTADFHAGNAEFSYTDSNGKKKILYHHGAKNVTNALNAAKTVFPACDKLLVAGESAGAFGCVAHAPAIAAMYPLRNETYIYSDGSSLYCPMWHEIYADIWKSEGIISDNADADAHLIKHLFKRAYAALGDDAVYMHSNSIYDDVLSAFGNKLNTGGYSNGPDVLEKFYENMQYEMSSLAGEIPNYRFYLTSYGLDKDKGTTPHTFSRWDERYYGKMEDETAISEWLNAAVNKNNPFSVGRKFIG